MRLLGLVNTSRRPQEVNEVPAGQRHSALPWANHKWWMCLNENAWKWCRMLTFRSSATAFLDSQQLQSTFRSDKTAVICTDFRVVNVEWRWLVWDWRVQVDRKITPDVRTSMLASPLRTYTVTAPSSPSHAISHAAQLLRCLSTFRQALFPSQNMQTANENRNWCQSVAAGCY